MTMQTFRTFSTLAEARAYRHEHGTGGWIFVPDDGGDTILFPPSMSPTAVMFHPFTEGQIGHLIGSQ